MSLIKKLTENKRKTVVTTRDLAEYIQKTRTIPVPSFMFTKKERRMMSKQKNNKTNNVGNNM